ncbi:flagellin [uncultured Pseudoflavonifractor sp.]|uniref:flagellin N-terminal helical domain-containing protein n=1 Tax=uncultured Pseudoflavonifractor sp. TaxID=1221379 RepID=UPI0025CECDB4|nr:flagellin [uncultured Pseudoflavonifractor sp.]
MRIQHNIMAMNAYRNYTNNTSALSKNLEKLSSGYKINRAGDDAAGLAISEKMRAQITGLETAQKNAKDGISLVQTAEGALTEVHDMLNRMVELADQSANGTYDDATDRDNLQKEFDQLKNEINRIADSSNFNGINLLDGSMDSNTKGIDITSKLSGTIGKAAITAGTQLDLSGTFAAGDSVTIDGRTYTFSAAADGSDGATFSNLASLATAASKNGVTIATGTPTQVTLTKDGADLTLQIGDTSASYNQLQVGIQDMHADKLGLTDDIKISDQASAQAAVDTIKNAINTVSSVRGTLGATQNRLDHTINNLSVMTENIQDAESTIRDTDVADEMMAYTKNNILVQSAQAMLAQANQVPQGVLQLLQ